MSAIWLRRRGATYTIIVMVTSVLLLVIGGAFVQPTNKLTQLQGLRDQQEQAKEALVGSAEWARVAVAAWPKDRKEESATVHFARATVQIELRANGEGVAAEATASVKPDVTIKATIQLAKRHDRWVVARLELPH